MLHAPSTFYTYTLHGVTRQMRRRDRAARAAYIAEALRQHAQIYGTQVVIPPHCIACGQLGAGDWCSTCAGEEDEALFFDQCCDYCGAPGADTTWWGAELCESCADAQE